MYWLRDGRSRGRGGRGGGGDGGQLCEWRAKLQTFAVQVVAGGPKGARVCGDRVRM
jgi:hypothetical protein